MRSFTENRTAVAIVSLGDNPTTDRAALSQRIAGFAKDHGAIQKIGDGWFENQHDGEVVVLFIPCEDDNAAAREELLTIARKAKQESILWSYPHTRDTFLYFTGDDRRERLGRLRTVPRAVAEAAPSRTQIGDTFLLAG